MILDKEYSFIDVKDYGKEIHAYYWKDGVKQVEVFNFEDYYFYIEPSKVSKILGYKEFQVTNEEHVSIDGKKLVKVLRSPFLDPIIKASLLTETYEIDMQPLNRWISKYKPKYTLNPKTIYLDIETIKQVDGNYSEASDANAPIIMITAYDSFDKRYYVFHYKDVEVEQMANVRIVKCQDEYKMLVSFLDFLKQKKPDYISGWNIESYDIPYIINRLIKKEIDPNCISPLGYQTCRKSEEISSHKFSSYYVRISGIGIFDLMSASQRLWLGKYCGYSLNAMSKNYLKDSKVEIEDIGYAYDNDFENLVRYNIKDVELCVRLDKELELFKSFQNFQEIISTNVNNCLVQSHNIFMYIMQQTDIILMNSNQKVDVPEPYEGGLVLETCPGIYTNCYKYDFISMYPSIMVTYNISPDTILKSKEDKCISMSDKYFFKQEEGIITKITKELYDRRIKYKKEGNKSLSLSYKLLMNSIYGQFNTPYSRMYSPECGKAITYKGREMIKYLTDVIPKVFNCNVLMGDTDSFCLYSKEGFDTSIPCSASDFYFETMYLKENVINNKLIKLELEKKIDKMIIFGSGEASIKKKYVELSEGKLKLTGLDSIKSDTQEIAKELQLELVDYIIKEKEPNKGGVKLIIERFRNKFNDAIKLNKYKYIAIPARLNKEAKDYENNSMSVTAIKDSNITIAVNERFFILKGLNTNCAFRSTTDIPNKFQIDKEAMWERVSNKADIFLNLFPHPTLKAWL